MKIKVSIPYIGVFASSKLPNSFRTWLQRMHFISIMGSWTPTTYKHFAITPVFGGWQWVTVKPETTDDPTRRRMSSSRHFSSSYTPSCFLVNNRPGTRAYRFDTIERNAHDRASELVSHISAISPKVYPWSRSGALKKESVLSLDRWSPDFIKNANYTRPWQGNTPRHEQRLHQPAIFQNPKNAWEINHAEIPDKKRIMSEVPTNCRDVIATSPPLNETDRSGILIDTVWQLLEHRQ